MVLELGRYRNGGGALLVVNSVFRLGSVFAMSIGPMIGGGAIKLVHCYDTCNDGGGVIVGTIVSPATFTFGAKRQFEIGLNLMVFSFVGGQTYPGGFIGVNWLLL